MTQNAIAVQNSAAEWGALQQKAQALVASGFLPNSIKTWQQAAAIISMGRELGIGDWAAVNGINVIQGKPTVSPQLMLAMINSKGVMEDMVISDDGTTCTVVMKRRGRSPHTYTFSDEDAKALGLLDRDNWKKQKKIMRQWRGVAGCARIVFPDVILNLYTPDEMGADVIADDEGNMTIVTVRPDHVDADGVITPEKPLQMPSGAGIQRPQPPEPPPASPLDDWYVDQEPNMPAPGDPVATNVEDDPNIYHCDRLTISKTRTATNYALGIVGKGKAVMVNDGDLLAKLSIDDTPVLELAVGTYPLDPAWSVTADYSKSGWDVHSIETGIPV